MVVVPVAPGPAFGARAALDLPEADGDFELELSERDRPLNVVIERMAIEPTASSLLPPSAVPMDLVDDQPSGLELDVEIGGRSSGHQHQEPDESPLAQVLGGYRRALEAPQTRASFTEWMSGVLDAISERGAVMEVQGESFVPVRILGAGAELSDPALALPLHGATSFGRCLASGRPWRGELNEPDELNFALRLGPTTRSVLIPVGASGGPQWVLWGVIPAGLASRDADFAELDRLAELASDAAKRLSG